MPYGSVLTDEVQSSTANTPPTFKDGNGTQVGTLCRAWVNFNGTGTVAIRGSFNVSSITDNGTGDYTANFTNALPDANYSAQVSAVNDSEALLGTQASGSCGVITRQQNTGTVQDASFVSVAIFR